ncbi:MAG: DUF1257 domain-containing protein [Planctomycetia bacterium]|nr:DUF1257 domain-containing protein [Planctomycetia bacterium]
MSHIVQIQTEVRDPVALTTACARLGLPTPIHRTVILYQAEATGLAVELPRWRYPVVCQTETGQLRYDNFGGRWGDRTQLDRLLQIYAVEKAKSAARKQGFGVSERTLEDGSILIRVQAA